MIRFATAFLSGWIAFWVRNLVNKASGKFYPDFLCRLKDGIILAVEYKGADRWNEAEDDRLIGGLWEILCGSACRFVMATDKNWASIDAKLAVKDTK